MILQEIINLLSRSNPNVNLFTWDLSIDDINGQAGSTPATPAPDPVVPQRRYITINGQRITVNGREIYLPPS